MMGVIGVLAFVVALLTSVMIHEAGHYFTAKRFGMKVTEFFLGFGKKIWSTQRGETEFGLKAIPAGGYCRIVGMSSNEELPEADASRAFYKASTPKRLIVLGSGSFLHFALGFFLIYMVGTHILIAIIVGLVLGLLFSHKGVKLVYKIPIVIISFLLIFWISDDVVDFTATKSLNVFESSTVNHLAN